MKGKNYPAEFMQLLKSVNARRPKTVIQHLLKYGQITTEELRNLYGYNHPPRAIRDVREHGIPIKMFRVTGSDGKKIAAYKFGDPEEVSSTQMSGRTAFSSKLKNALIDKHGSRCNISLQTFPERELQIDHRIPFEIIGNKNASEDLNAYMLLSASANRAKSWSCEHCENWQKKILSACQTCYWAYPESYTHIALRNIRRIELLWAGDEIQDYNKLIQEATNTRMEVPEYVKNVLQRHFMGKK